MDENTLFRSTLHGFNRDDVMAYITKITREHELSLSELEEQLNSVRGDLEASLTAQNLLQEQLDQVREERDALLNASEHKSDAELQLDQANEQIANLKAELAQAATEQEAAMDALRAETEQIVQKYQADAEGYNTLVDKAGRILLNAERVADTTVAQANTEAEAIRSEAQAGADRLREEAQAEADRLREDAKAECSMMRADAQAQVSAAKEEAASIQEETLSMFADSKRQFESMQESVGDSISRSLSEVERLRGMILNLNDTFNSASSAFDDIISQPASVGE